ncbi:hypothetical protein I2485_07630 [Nesterenkonia sp. E16_7]|uniref:hypothetical protein n=1 Tax=unclassified Nesterenkonia TaxID=2629769 RepID=UPI001A925C93|nr:MULTISPECIES: hypothetical protein [unclassified Nesterenkonia]MBO0595670.1 hypothetical protein [Nesterenkonia sp. E16_10]MBO0598523.1 hypothetical protein [Nesterenkonia sp. E16_7]
MSRRADRPITVTRTVHRRRRRVKAVAAIAVVAAAVGATGYGAWQLIEENEYLLDERCSVTVGEVEHRLTPAQTYAAAHLAAGAAERELPVQAATDAIAISLQETNLDDRADPVEEETEEVDAEEAEAAEPADSEEDPGAPAPVLFADGGPQWDAVKATSSTPTTAEDFYARLIQSREDGGEEAWSPELGLEEAAEALGRPQNPTFYPQHEELARAFARPLAGLQPMVMTCQLSQLEVPGPDAEGLRGELQSSLSGMLGEEATEVEGSGDSAVVRVSVSEVAEEAGATEAAEEDATEEDAAERSEPEWLVAQWAVAAAETYGVQSVHAGAYEWHRDSGRWERVETVSEDVEIGFSRR